MKNDKTENLAKENYVDSSIFSAVLNLYESLADPTGDTNLLLKDVAQFYDADRAYIFEIAPDRKTIDNTYEWCKEGVNPEIDNLQDVPIESVEVWIKEFEKSGAFYINSLDNDVEKSSLTYEVLEPQGIESLITAPLYTDDIISGFIGVDNPHRELDNLATLKTAAGIIYSGIRRRIAERREKETAINLQNKVFSQLFLDTFESAYYINIEDNSFVTLRQKEFLHEGYSYQTDWIEIITKYVEEGINPEDKRKFDMVCNLELLRKQIEKQPEFHVTFRDTSIGYERYCRLYVLRGEDCNHAAVGFMNVNEEVKNDEIKAIISAMTEDLDYISCIDLDTWDITRYRTTDNFYRVSDSVESGLPVRQRMIAFFKKIVHPDDWEMFAENTLIENVEKKLEENPVFKFECRTVDPDDGQIKWYRFVFAYADKEHRKLAMGILNIDEQVQRENETAILRERVKNKTIIDSIADAYISLYQLNLNDDTFRVQKNAYTVPEEYTREELPYSTSIGRWINEEIYPDDRMIALQASSIENIRKQFENNRAFAVNIRHNRYDNRYREMRFVRSADYEQTSTCFLSFMDNHENVVTQKVAERQEVIIDVLSEDYITVYTWNIDTDESTIVKIGNQTDDWIRNNVENFTSFTDFIDSFIKEKVHEDDKGIMTILFNKEQLRKTLAHKKHHRVTFRRVYDDGVKYLDCVIGKEEADDEAPRRLVVGFQDANERVRTEQAIQDDLKRALTMAQSASQAKTAFLNNMSHDIRTPMNAITGYTMMAKKHIDNPESVSDYLEKIDVSSQQLLLLINQVLEMSRIESGKVVLVDEPSDVIEKAYAIHTMAGADIERKGLRYSINVKDISHRYVLADTSRMNQIILNIVGNAVKYTPEGGKIEYTVEEKPYDKPEYSLYVFTIADTGIGMSEEYQKHVFEEFTRENTSTVSHIQGTGLGMPIVKKLIDLMDGTIEIKSKQGEGTTVIVSIPMKWDKEAVKHKDGAPSYETINYTGKRLLLVEDNEMNREIAIDILEDAGFIVETAEDGDIAVEMVKKTAQIGDSQYYDAVLMDIQMPRMNGYEATKAIRALSDPQNTHLPIVALSANAFEEDKQKSLDAGMDDHVAKPINIENLKETLAKYINKW